MGQQGKFLLNKVSFSMPWKNNILNLGDKKNLFFKVLVISLIFEFLFKNSIYIKLVKKKKKFFEKRKNFDHCYSIALTNVKKVKKFSRKIFFSQINALYYNSWFLIKFQTFILSKKKLEQRPSESFFRLQHLYHYFTPDQNKF